MKSYSLVINVILKSGKEKTYISYSPKALTKEEVMKISGEFENLIESVYKEEALGSIAFKVSPDKEIMINTKEIALIEFEIVEC